MKYVLVIGGAYGLGGRLAVVNSAYNYAIATNRKLIIDWRDNYYGFDINTSYFYKVFNIEDCNIIKNDIDTIINDKLSFFIPYKENYHGVKKITGSLSQQLFNNGCIKTNAAIWHTQDHLKLKDYDKIKDIDVILITEIINEYSHGMQFYKNLLPNYSINKMIIDFRNNIFQDNYVIGIHFRGGNGELDNLMENYQATMLCKFGKKNILLKYYNFIDNLINLKMKDGITPILFLCTDDINIRKSFFTKYKNIYETPKNYPKENTGSMHKYNAVSNTLREAIIDIWLLKQCNEILLSNGYFSKTVDIMTENKIYKFVDIKI